MYRPSLVAPDTSARKWSTSSVGRPLAALVAARPIQGKFTVYATHIPSVVAVGHPDAGRHEPVGFQKSATVLTCGFGLE
jgi:hypothetical protein